MQRVVNPPNDLFENGDPSSQTLGTRVMAEWLNAVQEELAKFIEFHGISLDTGDDEQLKKVMQRFYAEWRLEPNAVTFGAANVFTVDGDRSAIYVPGRAVKLIQTANDQGFVSWAIYDGISATTVLVTGCTVDDGLASVYFGQEPGNQPYSHAPTGALMDFPVSAPPPGWLECDGSAVSQVLYPELYEFLKDGGATCIYGEGPATFNLPDFRGEFIRGWDHGAGNDPDAATRTDRGDGTTGDNVGTKQADDLAAHQHDYDRTEQTGTSWTVGTGGAVISNVTRQSAATGGNETRPANTNVMRCIKY